MKILVIGIGYVGLVTGACFSHIGYSVTCLDIDQSKIKKLKGGELPFYEPGLEELVLAQDLHFTSNYQEALETAEVCFLALPTPSCTDGSCDITYVLSGAKMVARLAQKPIYLVIKSTVAVGTAQLVQQEVDQVLKERGVDFSLEVISNPEFLREGNAVYDCLHPERIVLGVESLEAAQFMQKLYEPFTVSDDRLLIMNRATAELAKYASNAMLATRISFINELSLVCEKVGADIGSIKATLGKDHRIGPHYLQPGLGFGGSCLPKDIAALKAMAKSANLPTPLLDAVSAVNESVPLFFLNKMEEELEGFSGKTLAIWGLSFKPNTDDLREAPSLFIINQLIHHGAHLRLFDPVSMEKARLLLEKYDQITFCSDPYEAAQGCDAIILVTEWAIFREIDLAKVSSLMRGRHLFDGRGQFGSSSLAQSLFNYVCIGTPLTGVVPA